MYGYDPLHIYDEISMFLTLSSKISFDKHKYIMKLKKQTGIFQNENSFMKTHKSCV